MKTMRPNDKTRTVGKGATFMALVFRSDGDFDDMGCWRSMTFLPAEPGYWGRFGGDTDEDGKRRHLLFEAADLSRRQFLLERDEGGWILQPSGEKNPTFVNGAKVNAPVRLENHSVIEASNGLIVWKQDWIPEKPAFAMLLASSGTNLPVPPEAVPSVALALALRTSPPAFEDLRREVRMLGRLACASWPNGMQSLTDFVERSCQGELGGVLARMQRLLGDPPVGVKESEAPRLVFNIDEMEVRFGDKRIDLTACQFVWYTALAKHRRSQVDDGWLGADNLDSLTTTARECSTKLWRGRELPDWIFRTKVWETKPFRSVRSTVRLKVKSACESAGLDPSHVVPDTRRENKRFSQRITLDPERIKIV